MIGCDILILGADSDRVKMIVLREDAGAMDIVWFLIDPTPTGPLALTGHQAAIHILYRDTNQDKLLACPHWVFPVCEGFLWKY